MKTSSEKSSTTTSKTAAQFSNQPFFVKAGSGDFFAPAAQPSGLIIQGDKRLLRTSSGQMVELPSDLSMVELLKIMTETQAAEKKLGKGPPPKPVPDVKKLARKEDKKEKTQPEVKGKKHAPGKGKAAAKAGGAAAALLKAAGGSKVAQYLAAKGAPVLLKGAGMLQKLRQNEQTHDDAAEKLTQSEKAVVIPPSEGQSKSNTGQVNTVSGRPAPAADENKAKQKLQDSLKENIPKSIEDVDNFKRDQKAQHMGADVMLVVQGDKNAVVSTFGDMQQTPPPAPPEHTPEALPPDEAAPPTDGMNLGQGAIAPLQNEHTDVSSYTKEADGKLKDEGVTQEQLDMVDSGELAEANKEKKGMEKSAKTEPIAVQTFARQATTKVDQDLKQEEKKGRDGLKAKRKAGLGATAQKQKGTKSALEKKREEVAIKINGIYTKAQDSVKKKLADLETQSMKRFDDGNAKATKEFEDNVNREIDAFKDDRYSGFFGWARKAKDWLLGMDDLPEVKAIFERNRATFVSTINKLVEDISTDNKRVIQECKDELANAKKEIKDFVDKLGPELKDVGNKAAKEMNSKLAELDQFVAKKEQELQDKLKDKQQAAIKAIDEKIEKMKEAMSGALAKLGKLLLWAAKKFFTWALQKFGYSLEEIEGIISRGAAVLKAIFTQPIQFVKNLMNAAITGFKNFGKNFLKHLQDALFEWLTGSLEGLVLPTTWDFKGIISVALQMIGISYQNIRKHMVAVMDEPTVAGLEKSFSLVKTLITEGPMAAWEQIEEMAGEMKKAFIDAVKDFIQTKIIEQAIQWVVSLFIPGAGIIKAIIGIYDTVVFFIKKAKQIMQMISNFLGSIAEIAAGNIGAAADAMERGLARGLSLVISFLAQLLHMSGITNKIKDAIQKIRDKVDAVLLKVAKWIAGKAKKVWGGVKTAAGTLVAWWENKKAFTTKTGEKHTLLFKGEKQSAKLVVRTVETEIPDLLRTGGPFHKSIETSGTSAQKASYATAMGHTKTILAAKAKLDANANDATAAKELNTAFLQLTDDLIILGVSVQAEADLPMTNPKYNVDSTGKPVHVVAEPLTKKGNKSSPTPQKNILGWTSIPATDVVNWERTHVLSAELFGSNKQQNLLAARRSTNAWFREGPEEAGKKYTSGNTVTYYEARISYHSPPPPPAVDFPAKIDITIGTLKKEGDAWKRERILLAYPTQTPSLPNFAAGPGTLPNLRFAGHTVLYEMGKIPIRLAMVISSNRPSGGYASLSALMTTLQAYYANQDKTSPYATTYRQVINNAINNKTVEFV
ncbi:MAG: phage tail protein [Methylobacter sp.]